MGIECNHLSFVVVEMVLDDLLSRNCHSPAENGREIFLEGGDIVFCVGARDGLTIGYDS